MSEAGQGKVKKVPAPWTCRGQVYAIFFYTRPGNRKVAEDLPAVAFSSLERESYFASAEAGRFCGGLGGFMVIRYTDTPVGPYDELLIIPGSYSYRVKGEDGKLVEKKNPRITRIYVSQRDTLFNGRHNWNIPKQLARFDWKDLPAGAKQVQVFPYDDDTTASSNLAGAAESPSNDGPKPPFFQASFKTIPYVPAFPMSTHWAKYVGMDTTLVQPPVPQGGKPGARGDEEKEEELVVVGTDKWCRCVVAQQSSRTHVGWFDLSQEDQHGGQSSHAALFKNFWPEMGRWQLGIRMDDAKIEIPEGEFWEKPRASL